MRSLSVIALAAAVGLLSSNFSAYADRRQRAPKPVEVVNFPAVQDVNVLNSPTSPARFQIVGFTTGTLPGGGAGSGLLALSRICGAEITGARQCSAREVIESTTALPAFTGVAWVRAEPQPGSSAFSWSGFAYGSSTTCGQWANGTSNAFGLVVTVESSNADAPQLSPLTGFLTEHCNAELPVACCALVP